MGNKIKYSIIYQFSMLKLKNILKDAQKVNNPQGFFNVTAIFRVFTQPIITTASLKP